VPAFVALSCFVSVFFLLAADTSVFGRRST